MKRKKYASRLERHIDEMRADKEQMPGKLTNALVSLAGLFLNKNSQDGTASFAGLLGMTQPENEETDDVVATYRKVEDIPVNVERAETDMPEEDLQYTGNATEQDFDRLERSLIPLFAEEHRETVSTVVSAMYHHNSLIPEIADLLSGEEQQAA